MRVERDYAELLELFNKNRVRYCIVGAYAVGFHGLPRYTKDIDILVEPSLENSLRVVKSLDKFGFKNTGLAKDDFTEEDRIVQLGVEPVRIDIITSIGGVSFDEVWKRRKVYQYGNQKVFFMGLEALIKAKKASGRIQDKADLEKLLKINKKRRRQMRKKNLFVLLVSGLYLLLSIHKGFSAEQLTITTYYPSPYGSYQDLETQRLAVGYPAGSPIFWNNFATVRTGYGDTIAIGGENAGNDLEIRISAPSSRNTVTFWNSKPDVNALANIKAANLPGCLRFNFSRDSGNQACPEGYAITQATVSASESGNFLCCAYQ